MRVWESHRFTALEVTGLIFSACLLFAGCGSGLDIAPTRGTISVKGEKLTHGRVMFMPIGGGQPAVGEIQPDGSFVMSTVDEGDGALVGEHSVQITQREDDVEPGKQAYNFESPADEPIVVKSGEENVLNIDIDTDKGWQVRINR